MNSFQPQPTSSAIEIPESIQNIGNQIGDTVNNLSQTVSSGINSFSQQAEAGVDASSGFLSSNTIIAKFAFIILIIIVLIFLLNLGVLIIQYFISPSSSPYLVDGMIEGTNGISISQDPKKSGSILIRRSNNESSGMEFTWSTWIRIDELSSGTIHKHVFNKGNDKFDVTTGIATVANGPGLYISSNQVGENADTATINVIMTTSLTNGSENIQVDDIPLKQWVNITIRLQNTILDVYVNGTVAGRLNLTQVPNQNYYDVNICKNGGFVGKLSNLRYYDHALNIFQISKLVAAGPNTNAAATQTVMSNYNYLSTAWYTAKL
jgi:hypothetical protein